ncbi:MAG: universal stress protein [Desulfarculus sp.]|nr:universal stress protein [Desulfarculus sp.]
MKILAAHDGSAPADQALLFAAEVAQKLGGQLHLVTVVPDLCLSSEEVSPNECSLISSSLEHDAQGGLKKAQELLTQQGVKALTHFKTGRPVDGILDAAEEIGADMIVVGSHGKHGAKRWLLGSVSTKVAEYAKCKVLIVK